MVKLFEVGYLLTVKGVNSAIVQLTAVNKRIEALGKARPNLDAIENVGKSLTKVGAISMGAGAVGGAALYAMIRPAMEYAGVWAHISTALNDGAATMSHIAGAQKLANTLSAAGVITTENLGQAYYTARSNMMSHAQALAEVAAANKLVIGTTLDAASANSQMVQTTRMLATMDKLFSGGSMMHADQLAAMQTRYAMLDVGEVVNSLKYIQPLGAMAGISTTQLEAIAATLSLGGMHGEEAGTGAREVLMRLLNGKAMRAFQVTTASGGFDAISTVGRLVDSLKGLSDMQRTAALHGLGFNMRDITGIGILIKSYNDLKATNLDLMNSAGAASAAMAKRLAAPDEQLDRFWNNLHNLGVTLGNALLPQVNILIPKLISLVQSLNAFASGHSEAIKRTLEVMAALSALSIGVGAVTFLTGGAITLISKLPALLRLWTMAQWMLNAALAGNPIGIAIIAIAALGAAVYEIYKHWSGITAFFANLWNKIHSIQWKQLGIDILKAIGEGILSAIPYMLGPVGIAAKLIYDHFKMHSPARMGPLHNLPPIGIVETIADSLRPAPVLRAINRLAMVTAVGVPLALGATSLNAMAGSAGGRGGVAPIVINYAPVVTIEAGAPADVRKAVLDALRDQQYELGKMVDRVISDRQRSEF